MFLKRILWALPLAIFLAGCGGGSDGPGTKAIGAAPSASELAGRIAYLQLGTFTDAQGGTGLRRDVYAINANGTGRVRLSPESPAISPSPPLISPDGTRVAFGFYGNGAGNSGGTYLANSDGSGLRLLPVQGDGVPVAFSRDGQSLIYSVFSPVEGDFQRQNYFSVNLDGQSAPRPLGADAAQNFGPAVSPDGQRRAIFERDGRDSFQIYIERTDGSGPKIPVTSGFTAKNSPTFAPDGQRLAFVESNGDTEQIVTVNLDGSGERRIPAVTGRKFDLSFSPDGRYISYTAGFPSRVVSSAPTLRIYIARADGSSQSRLLTDEGLTGEQRSPSWGR